MIALLNTGRNSIKLLKKQAEKVEKYKNKTKQI